MTSTSETNITDPLQLVIEGVNAKEAGRFSEARRLMLLALEIAPDHATANFEFAVLLSVSGDHFDAVQHFQRALSVDPSNPRIARELAKNAAFLGFDRLMDDTLNRLELAPENVKFAAFIRQFSAYVEAFPLETSAAWIGKLKQAHEYLGAEQIIERILLAVEQKRPFSFVRLGDGEGSHLKLSVTDEARFGELYDYARELFRDIWFQKKYGRPDDFDRLYEEVVKAAQGADILGVPYESWLRHEFKIASPNGICSLTNIVRLLMRQETPTQIAFCDQNIHFAMAQTSFFERLFALDATFHLISSHTGLGPRIEGAFGVEKVILHKIPGEGAYKQLIGDEADQRLHFPEVFETIRNELKSQSWLGHVFIVSAGYLGKIYCQDIKAGGGVAVDLGSVADGLMGKITRPGMESVANLEA